MDQNLVISDDILLFAYLFILSFIALNIAKQKCSIEFSSIIKMLYICASQYKSHQLYVAIEHFKCS